MKSASFLYIELGKELIKDYKYPGAVSIICREHGVVGSYNLATYRAYSNNLTRLLNKGRRDFPCNKCEKANKPVLSSKLIRRGTPLNRKMIL